ncbi:MAG: thymidine kinase [Candidatus Eremiobacteraeota bacterium]|nr:thymidine kinase [Candidatus Eremiobacteraeota bacterium]
MAKLYFRYSAMNAGKSTALLQVAHNYESQGRAVAIYTAELDSRFGIGVVTSRLGISRQTRTFNASTDFAQELTGSNDWSNVANQRSDAAGERSDGAVLVCVLIDESQFLSPTQVFDLHRIAHVQNIPVICYGLRSDFVGEPFPGASYLMTLADSIEELKTVCPCGKKATMNVRFDKQGRRLRTGSQIAIEGTVSYIPMCGTCFYTKD